MKKKYKIIFVLFTFVIVVVSISFISLYAIPSAYAKDLVVRRNEILDSFDNRLNDIEYAEDLARSYIEVYKVTNKSEFDKIKSDLYDKLSEEMKKEFDLQESNIHYDNITSRCVIMNVFKSVDESDSIMFKIHFYLIKDNKVDKKQVAFVTVKDKLITSITRIDDLS